MSDRVLPESNPYNPAVGFYSGVNCIICHAPCAAAPSMIEFVNEEDPVAMICRVRRQPENDEEIGQMIDAMECSCTENIHYSGTDPRILEIIQARRTRSGQER